MQMILSVITNLQATRRPLRNAASRAFKIAGGVRAATL
jgi:hypothetical protein